MLLEKSSGSDIFTFSFELVLIENLESIILFYSSKSELVVKSVDHHNQSDILLVKFIKNMINSQALLNMFFAVYISYDATSNALNTNGNANNSTIVKISQIIIYLILFQAFVILSASPREKINWKMDTINDAIDPPNIIITTIAKTVSITVSKLAFWANSGIFILKKIIQT